MKLLQTKEIYKFGGRGRIIGCTRSSLSHKQYNPILSDVHCYRMYVSGMFGQVLYCVHKMTLVCLFAGHVLLYKICVVWNNVNVAKIVTTTICVIVFISIHIQICLYVVCVWSMCMCDNAPARTLKQVCYVLILPSFCLFVRFHIEFFVLCG